MTTEYESNSVTAQRLDRRFCLAPMMDLSDRHFRYLFRLISADALLYTEMLTSSAVVHGERKKLLLFNPEEHPLALQLGGSDAKQLADACKIGEEFGFDEVNLNCGCPSDRVQAGGIGACLMAEPLRVAECLHQMQAVVQIPVTVKCRIGIDNQDSFEALQCFVQTLYDAGCRVFIIHARKAWLSGLSPRQNREVPPLDYEFVYQIKQAFQNCQIVINGGIKDTFAVQTHLAQVDGVMLGREAYYNPFAMIPILREIYSESTNIPVTRKQLLEKYLEYINGQQMLGIPLSRLTRHLIALYKSVPGARAWRRHLSESMHKAQSAEMLLKEAMTYVCDG